MGVPCYNKMLIFVLVSLLIDLTNFAKAENYKDKVYNYDSYEYPGYEYPDSRSTYIFFHACTDYFTTGPELLIEDFSGFEKSLRFHTWPEWILRSKSSE